MDFREEYKLLIKSSIKQDDNILADKKKAALQHFRGNLNAYCIALAKNYGKTFILYVAPVRQIHGSFLVCFPYSNCIDIFVDPEFLKKNPAYINVILQHEVLHGLSQEKNLDQFSFGHSVRENYKNYVGVDEAVTQMFAEDIQGVRLSSKEDYLLYVKNMMRILKSIFGAELIAAQYIKGDLTFENTVNKLMDYKFEAFAIKMKEVYTLWKKEFYSFLTQEEIIKKENIEHDINVFISSLIKKCPIENLNNILYQELDQEFIDRYKDKIGILTERIV
ncbi:MAG: hypothetical protein IKX00_02480 [Bacilli bacterium]|nr:hypothetical protein [Bacilli bacterium]